MTHVGSLTYVVFLRCFFALYVCNRVNCTFVVLLFCSKLYQIKLKKKVLRRLEFRRGFENNGILNEKIGVRIIFSLGNDCCRMLEICCKLDNNGHNALKLGELQCIIEEIFNFHTYKSKSIHHKCFIQLLHFSPFFGMNLDDVIPTKSNCAFDNVYYMSLAHFMPGFEPNKVIKRNSDINCKPDCKKGEKCNVIKKLQDKTKRKHLFANAKKFNIALSHLNNENHLISLPFEECPNKECVSFDNSLIKLQPKLNDVEVKENDKDKMHMHLYSHSTKISELAAIANTPDDYKDGTEASKNSPFEYTDIKSYRPKVKGDFWDKYTCKSLRSTNLKIYQQIMLLLLMKEVIKNNFEADLIQKNNEEKEENKNVQRDNHKQLEDKKRSASELTDLDKILDKYGAYNIIYTLFNIEEGNMTEMINNNAILKQAIMTTPWGSIMNELKEKYTLLSRLDTKMNDGYHQELGSPLDPHEMLAIILYTSGKCNYTFSDDLRQCDQSTLEFIPKWKYLDFDLYCAISKLSAHEQWTGCIYTGLCNIWLDIDKFRHQQEKCVLLKSYTSFSFDLNVALENSGTTGVIFGLDLKQYAHMNILPTKDQKDARKLAANVPLRIPNSIKWCDVSWLSKFPTEREILVAKHELLPVYIDKIYNIKQHQYVVCHPTNNKLASFENIFLKFVPPPKKNHDQSQQQDL